MPGGKVFPAMFEMLSGLRYKNKAELVVISDDKRALSLAQSPILLPSGIPEWLSPIVGIAPAQLFVDHLKPGCVGQMNAGQDFIGSFG